MMPMGTLHSLFGRGSCPLVFEDQLIVNVGGDMCVASF